MKTLKELNAEWASTKAYVKEALEGDCIVPISLSGIVSTADQYREMVDRLLEAVDESVRFYNAEIDEMPLTLALAVELGITTYQ